MSEAQVVFKGIEFSLPWNGRKMILQVPLEQALQEEKLSTKFKTKLKWVKILEGELSRVFTDQGDVKAQVWFPADGNALENFLTVKDLQITSYSMRLQFPLESYVHIYVHEENDFVDSIERKREKLGVQVDQLEEFLKSMREKEGKFYGAYTEGRIPTVYMEFFFKDKEDWLTAIGALE